MLLLPTDIAPFLSTDFSLTEKRPGILQLSAPFYHEDGDMVEVFITAGSSPDKVIITDYGMTLMRLSYTYEIDTPNKEKILHRILNANGLTLIEGGIEREVELSHLAVSIIQFIQGIIKISNMNMYQREVVHSLFMEQLEDFIEENLSEYQPTKDYLPFPNQPEYMVDYCFNHRERPIFLFAVNNPSNAKLATISCQKFQMEKIHFKGVIVLENMEVIIKKDLARIMSVADKQFPSFLDFKEHAQTFFDREGEFKA